MTNAVQPPEFQDEATLFSLASEYFEAATILVRPPATRTKVDSVVYYLLGHAAELLLKCFLHKRGVSIEKLKRQYSHGLAGLVDSAQSHGLDDRVSLKHVRDLSQIYEAKRLEYRWNMAATFPSIDDLLEDVRSLQSRVFDHVADY
jgi:hypothetical protein